MIKMLLLDRIREYFGEIIGHLLLVDPIKVFIERKNVSHSKLNEGSVAFPVFGLLPFSNLFATSVVHLCGDESPVFSILVDELHDENVFIAGPGASYF